MVSLMSRVIGGFAYGSTIQLGSFFNHLNTDDYDTDDADDADDTGLSEDLPPLIPDSDALPVLLEWTRAG